MWNVALLLWLPGTAHRHRQARTHGDRRFCTAGWCRWAETWCERNVFVLLSRTKFERACERVLPAFWGWVRMRGWRWGGWGVGAGRCCRLSERELKQVLVPTRWKFNSGCCSHPLVFSPLYSLPSSHGPSWLLSVFFFYLSQMKSKGGIFVLSSWRFCTVLWHQWLQIL